MEVRKPKNYIEFGLRLVVVDIRAVVDFFFKTKVEDTIKASLSN